jgi:Zn-dependent protease
VKAVRSARATMGPTPLASQAKSVLLPPRAEKLHFSKTEIRHLIVGTILVTAAGITFFLGGPMSMVGLVLAAVLFSLGFIVHELAHKYVAQAYGLWAEFRLNMMGVVLTAVSILSPLKFIAPGAVVITGFPDKDKMGLTAVAGPVVNVIITVGLLVLLPGLENSIIYHAVLAGAAINAFLAVFNLIPFAIFDGRKVYVWNKRYWAVLFVVSLALTVYTNFVLSPF